MFQSTPPRGGRRSISNYLFFKIVFPIIREPSLPLIFSIQLSKIISYYISAYNKL